MGLNTYYNPGTPQRLFVVGDSKSGGVYGAWIGMLMHSLYKESAGNNYIQPPDCSGYGGHTVGDMSLDVPADLPSKSATADIILINLGANDVNSALPAEATWKANMLIIIDTLHTKYPNAPIYCARAWKRDVDDRCDTMATWLDDVIAARSDFVHLGHDERGWMKGANNGATMTTDGVHYSAAGIVECAAQWGTVLGY